MLFRSRYRITPHGLPIRSFADVEKRFEYHDREEQRFRDEVVRDIATIESGGSGPSIPGGSPPPSNVWYTHWFFPNENAGMVLIGRINGTLGRLWVDDEQGNHNDINLDISVFRVENGAIVTTGDMRFLSAFSGPILHGRFRQTNSGQNCYYRLFLDDTNPNDIALRHEYILASSINAGDFHFAGTGFSFVNKGRTWAHRWEWYIDNSEGDLAEGSALRLERFDG